MKLHRFLITCLCVIPVLVVMDGLIENSDIMPQDAAPPFIWTACVWLWALAVWPLLVYAWIFGHDPSGIFYVSLLLMTISFWGVVVELFIMMKTWLWPNTALEPTPTAP